MQVSFEAIAQKLWRPGPVRPGLDLRHRPSGSFFTLLGPSGLRQDHALLRMLGEFRAAGRRGAIEFSEEDCVTHVPVHRRGVGMVFEDYALFPDHSVLANIVYGLAARDVDRAAAEQRALAMRRPRGPEGAGRPLARGPVGAASGSASRWRAALVIRARRTAAGRAAVGAGRQAARRAAAACCASCRPRPGHHDRVRHARPGRSAGAVRPDRRDGPRAHRPDRPAAPRSMPGPAPRSPPISSGDQPHRHRRGTARGRQRAAPPGRRRPASS